MEPSNFGQILSSAALFDAVGHNRKYIRTLGARWLSGTIAQPAIAPQQAPTLDVNLGPSVQTHKPTGLQDLLLKRVGHVHFGHYRLPQAGFSHHHLPDTTATASHADHEQADRERSSNVTAMQPCIGVRPPHYAKSAGACRPEWCPKKWLRATGKY